MLTNLGALEWPHHDRTGACLLRYPDRGLVELALSAPTFQQLMQRAGVDPTN